MKTRVSLIGLGLMGTPMSKNLIKEGHDVTVWNRTASRMDDVVAVGATASTSAREAAARSEITITIVPDSADVEEVILGKDGVIEGAAPGSVVIDMSTISPSVTRVIAGRLSEKDPRNERATLLKTEDLQSLFRFPLEATMDTEINASRSYAMRSDDHRQGG